MNKHRILSALFLLLACAGVFSQTASENYVRIRTFLSADSSAWRDRVVYYDGLDRIISSSYDNTLGMEDYFDTEYAYDDHGNLTYIGRYAQSATSNLYDKVDDMSLSYDGNRLTDISQGADVDDFCDYVPYGDPEATDGTCTYDQNGNMTSNHRKGISSIVYNPLNLPELIQFTNGNTIRLTYDMTGGKKRVVYTTMSPAGGQTVTTTLDYCGSLVYQDYSLKYIRLEDDGIWNANGGYCFYIRDHLGSVRSVNKLNGSCVQTSQYYPFGRMWDDFSWGSGSTQPFRFGGKELDKMHGLDWYDCGARMYDPGIGRFTSMDPKAEDYYETSPYVYCLNNSIKFLDKNGEAPGDFFSTVDDAAKDFGFFYNDNSIRQNKEFASYIFEVKDEQGNKGYSYSMASVGDEQCSMPIMEIGAKNVATIHTHASYNNKYGMGNNLFSGSFSKDGELLTNKQKRASRTANNDVGNANMRQIDSYVATPNGSLQKYSPSTGRITIISNEMPSDINDPDRLNKIGTQEANPITLSKSLIMQQNIYKGILNNKIK